jgi:hypothetical protein
MGFEVLTAVNGSVFVFLIVTPCGVVGRPEDGDSLLLRNVGILPGSPHGFALQKTNIDSKVYTFRSRRTILANRS